MNCRGLHCDGCRGGGGPALGLIIALVIAAIIAAKAKAITHALAEAGHVLALVAIAGASVALAAGIVILGLIIRRKLRQVERATGAMQSTLEAHGYTVRTLPEPRAALPEARADIPAQVWIHPPRDESRVTR